MRLIFWHNIISPHQAPFMSELAKAGHDVLVVSAEEMTDDRRQLGWDIPDMESVRVLFCSNSDQVEKIVSESLPDSIHIIAGARAVPLGAKVAASCRKIGRRTGIITEAPDPRGLGGGLRRIKYSWERVTRGRDFDFVFAMGQQGVDWFRACGYSEEQIFPFAYVTEQRPVSFQQNLHTVFQFVFVGRLVHLKGLDLLLSALKNIPHAELTIIGDGPERKSLEKFASLCEVNDRVRWMGQMRNDQIMSFLLAADVLVLPSRKDGWGAVVNESLMVGTPVICSSVCGASELIRHAWLGTVFHANDISSLQAALALWCNKSTISINHRKRVQKWSQCIDGFNVAKYLEQVLLHVYEGGVRPQPPWRAFDSE